MTEMKSPNVHAKKNRNDTLRKRMNPEQRREFTRLLFA